MRTPCTRLTWTALAVALAVAAPPVAASDDDRCRKLVRLSDVAHAIEPGIAVAATEVTPAHCRVRGVVNRAIRFEVTLPDAWNGRMMFTAVGGNAGMIGDTTSLLERGFAMASTDTGHEAEEESAFLAQPEARLDFAFGGVHLATLAAKRVIAHYYGRDPAHAYLQGCSNGGRAALLEAERFPDDYDGIIAGAPVFRLSEFLPWAVAVHDRQDAHPLDKDAFVVLDKASRTACDALDGVEDGVINDPRICRVDVDAFVCADGETTGCLTAGQADTARFIYADLVDGEGNVLSPGVPPGAESFGDWGLWLLGSEAFRMGEGLRESLALHMRRDPSFDVTALDVARDRPRVEETLVPFDSTGDLADFRARGGKLLMYQGWNDFPLRPQRAINYLARVDEATGGPARTGEFLRLFMVPGMVHCAGGPGPWQADYVDAIVKWTEEGEAPERIVATQPGEVIPMAHLNPSESAAASRAFTRPLCVYPKLAVYSGEGDPDEEGSFHCAVP